MLSEPWKFNFSVTFKIPSILSKTKNLENPLSILPVFRHGTHFTKR